MLHECPCLREWYKGLDGNQYRDAILHKDCIPRPKPDLFMDKCSLSGPVNPVSPVLSFRKLPTGKSQSSSWQISQGPRPLPETVYGISQMSQNTTGIQDVVFGQI